MTYICIFVGLGLIVCGLVLAILTKEKSKTSSHTLPPPLPRRRGNIALNYSSVLSYSTAHNSTVVSTKLPRRRQSRVPVRGNNNTRYMNPNGPRGLTPDKFPRCPYDGRHNEIGKPQVIFWVPNEGVYKCSKGHKIGKNGLMI